MANIYDVAKKANVSIATVSNVINEKNNEVSEKIRKKVLRIMEEIGYIPSKVAINLARGKTKVIGIVVSDINNPFFSELVREVENILYKLGFDLFLVDTGYDLNKGKELVERLISSRLDGIMLLNNEIDDNIAKILSKNKIPTVLYSWDSIYDYVCNLKVDFRKGMKSALKNLYELNHRKIIFTKSTKKLKTFIDRKETFVELVNELDFKDFRFKIFEGESTIVGGQETVKKILSDKSFRPTAIMSVNDIQAIGILFSLHNHNIRVPEDISLIGLDNIYLSSAVIPKLTTIDLSAKRVASVIIRMLLDLIKSEDKRGYEEIIETKLVLRDSVKKVN